MIPISLLEATATPPMDLVGTLTSYGALGVLLIYFIWKDWHHSKNQQKHIDDHIEVQEKSNEVMHEMKNLLSQVFIVLDKRKDD